MSSAASIEPSLGHPKRLEQQWRRVANISPQNQRTSKFGIADYELALKDLGKKRDAAISVYLHLPFCPVRCLYCGCNTTITHSTERIDYYLDCLEHEMDLVIEKIGAERDLLQFHVGGGTPNYLNDSQLVRLMAMVKQRFRILGETEVSIECNPRRASAGQLSLLRGIGFRRISFGVQDLQPEVQRAIGRIHSKELVRDVCVMAREAGFEYINLDLIYGLPHQTEQSFQDTLASIIEMGPDRVSCFAYTHSPVSRPHQHALATEHLPSHQDRLALFQQAANRFTESGYTWVGLDSFVLDTDELAIAQEERRLHRNCIGYTGTSSKYLISFGMGAIGDIDGVVVQNADNLQEWLTAISEDHLPISYGHRLDKAQRRRRDAMMELICNLQVPKALAQGSLPKEFARLPQYIRDGLVEVEAESESIRLTLRGRQYLHKLCVNPRIRLRTDRTLWPLLQNV